MRIAVHDYAGHPFQFDLSRELARRGHDVLHLYFKGDPGPKGQTTRTLKDPPNFAIAAINIERAYRKGEFISRVRNDLEYGAALVNAVRAFKPDVVISGNTPLDAQRLLVNYANSSNVRFVFWMQDFYSRAMRGLIGRRWLGIGAAIANRYERLERALLRASDAIVLISDDFLPSVEALGVDADRLHVIPNWGAIESLPVRDKANAWSQAHGFADRFVFLYSGTLGLKHNPDLLLALADHFEADREVLVVVAASGLGREQLEASLAARQRPNLQLLDLQPLDVVADMFGSADVTVALLETDAGEFSMPSKVLSYYCAERPLLLSAPLGNASARSTMAIGAGRVVPPDDPAAFVAAAQALRDDPVERAKAARAGRVYAETNFRIEAVTDRFEGVFSTSLR